MHHLDHYVLLKIVVVITTAVVIVYLAAIGYIDFDSTSSQSALTPSEAGELLVQSGSYTEAIDLYGDQIDSLEDGLVEANLGLAAAYTANNELADAEAIYRRTLRLDPSAIQAYIGLAEVLIDQGRETEAQAVVDDGFTVEPAQADLLKLDRDLLQNLSS